MTAEIPFEAIIADANDVVIVTRASPLDEPGPEIVYVNEAFCRLTGYSRDEALGKTPRMLQGGGTDPAARRRIRQALERGDAVEVEILNYGKFGQEYWLDLRIVPLRDSSGKVRYFAAIERDTTERKRMERQLYELATRDGLTGAANRRLFMEQAALEFARGQRHMRGLSLALLDLDGLRHVNERHGREAGDMLLQAAGASCMRLLRQTDVIGRLDGGLFGILLPEVPLDAAGIVAERMRKAVAQVRLARSDGEVGITASVGMAALRADDDSAEKLLGRAGSALEQAKDDGGNHTRLADS